MGSIREIAGCLGFSGNFSVLRALYGYPNGSKFPKVSLLNQINVLKNGPHIVLHIKMVNPSWPDPSTKSPLSGNSIIECIEGMRVVYSTVGIGVVIKSFEVLDNPDFQDIDIAECETSEDWFYGTTSSTTDEQRALFSNTNYVEFLTRGTYEGGEEQYTIELRVYFVGTTNPPANGCATGGSAVVARVGNLYTLAHEVGHLLGLDHFDDADRLMRSGRRINLPPDLVSSEGETMKKSYYMHPHC